MQNKTKTIALMSTYAALYVALVLIFSETSFGPIQLRIADTLVAAVPLIGFAGVIGHTLGVFIGNIFSPDLGLIDLLNTIPSFIMAFVVYFVYKKTNNNYTVIGTCIAYSAVLGTTVGWMLHYMFELPLIITIVTVTVGNIIASVLIGWPLFMVLKKIGIQHLIGQKIKTVEAKNDDDEQEMCCCS
ncbi:MAG: QueT transporter family protein [Candidatus Bathyarchaeota archaeon]|nr:QueT transporter family protein [Candidatus Termiticorpusculum sp.]MCL2869047.1 QueT transporter family protein [Candidatus Termiticorpusculum sp.]